MYLCLDLSLASTGYAKFSDNGRLMKKGKIIPSETISNNLKIHFIVNKIKQLFKNVDNLVIENVYYGKNFKMVMWLSRLSGGVIYSWVDYKYCDPKYYGASTARRLTGVSGNAHKSEIQVYVLEKYKYASKKIISKFKSKIEELKGKYKKKDISRGAYKYRLTKISKQIEEETGIGNDLADAIILGLAYYEEKKNK